MDAQCSHAYFRDMTSGSTLDDAMIERLVRIFYGRARQDSLLGPIFESRITDWEPHLRRIIDFWSGVMLKTGRYQGQPMRAHLGLPIGDEHFARWIALFGETADEVAGPEIGALFRERARMIGESLKLGLAVQNGTFGRPAPRRAGPV